jgi:hypothetical protein
MDDSKIPRVSIGDTLKEVIYEISEKRLGATVVEIMESFLDWLPMETFVGFWRKKKILVDYLPPT